MAHKKRGVGPSRFYGTGTVERERERGREGEKGQEVSHLVQVKTV